MDVDGHTCVWEEGQAFMFDDTFPHEVHNDTDEERVVLLIDVERPMTRKGLIASRLAMWILRRTAYVVDARRNQEMWDERLRSRLQAEGKI